MMQSKPTLDTILSHRSIRRFTSEPIADEILDTLVRAGQQAFDFQQSAMRFHHPRIRPCAEAGDT